MKVLSFFNHKGGVSKTTTTFNVGWKLAEYGHRVVIVDLDPQCNLTGQVFGIEMLDDDFIERYYNNRNTLHLGSITDRLIDGQSAETISAAETGQLYQTKNENLFLLPGNLNISDLDSQISVSLKVSAGIPATRNIIGNLPKVIRAIGAKFGADYMLLDLSPGIGGLNQVVIMSSDYFIVPTTPDYFSLQAIDSLAHTIPKWYREIKRFREENGFVGADYPIHNQAKFMGIIQQRYRPRGGVPASSFARWIEKIHLEVNNKLVPELKKIQCIVDEDVVRDALEGSGLVPYSLAYISDFNSLIAISQQAQKPIFALTEKDIKESSNVFGYGLNTIIESRDAFDVVFADLAERLINLMNG